MNGSLFVISAPSGVGKSTLVTSLVDRIGTSHKVRRVITYTTKKPRITEVDGKDYFFISEFEFVKKIEAQFFLEWSMAYGAYYGSPVSIINDLSAGHSFIIILDRLGTQQVIKKVPDAVLIWLYTHDFGDIKNRLTERGMESEADLLFRLAHAATEIRQEKEQRIYQFHVLNHNKEQALLCLETICKKKLEI